MLHSILGVPCAKMERFAGVDTQTCASLYLKIHAIKEGFWGEVVVCLCRTQVKLKINL